jgi:hypothetical protein
MERSYHATVTKLMYDSRRVANPRGIERTCSS